MDPQVEINTGKIEGIDARGYLTFRGIPFAKPPVGKLRFVPPQPPESWAGTREAKSFGHAALQRKSEVAFMDPGVPIDEDCLYLNVDTLSTEGSRPVMMWIHGGGFNLGSGSQPGYRGTHLVKRGDVVLVTINYRLGMFGYMDLSEHGGESWGASANLGQLDQIAALEWIRDNITAFGGDPNNVTIFGESAGSVAVAALLGMPKAKGLFHKAIAQSGTANLLLDSAMANRISGTILNELGLDRESSHKIQELSYKELVRTQQPALEKMGNMGIFGRLFGFWPCIDGKTLPRSPLEAVREGSAKGIPLIYGSNRDESKFAEVLSGQKAAAMDDDTLHERVSQILGKRAKHTDMMIETYRESRKALDLPHENSDIFSALNTDQTMRMPGLRLLEAQMPHEVRSYNYLFCYELPSAKAAIHGLEIPFVFGHVGGEGKDSEMRVSGDRAQALSNKMLGAWTAFAHTGDPSIEGLAWKPFDLQNRTTMVFDIESKLVNDPFGKERAAWDAISLRRNITSTVPDIG